MRGIESIREVNANAKNQVRPATVEPCVWMGKPEEFHPPMLDVLPAGWRRTGAVHFGSIDGLKDELQIGKGYVILGMGGVYASLLGQMMLVECERTVKAGPLNRYEDFLPNRQKKAA